MLSQWRFTNLRLPNPLIRGALLGCYLCPFRVVLMSLVPILRTPNQVPLNNIDIDAVECNGASSQGSAEAKRLRRGGRHYPQSPS